MRILIATDAWRPQVNGVVRTYERLDEELTTLGVEPNYLTPADFRTMACPTYPEIRLALPGHSYIARRLADEKPDAIHVATEGPVGWMMRRWCLKNHVPFTTSFHTRFPEYLSSRFKLPVEISYSALRRFHNAGVGLMVASPSLAFELETRGFQRTMPWTKGVDTDVFKPSALRLFDKEPVFLCVGRVAVEKNLDAFLRLDLPGRKVVVGSGPMLTQLKARYPDVLFTGKMVGQALADCFASADVFVFPSLTDTFGIVLLEAMASGLPVAAYPVVGPRDIVVQGETGVLDVDLRKACLAALEIDRSRVRSHAETFSWEHAARLFISNIESALFAAQGRRIPVRQPMLARRSPRQA